MPEGGVESGFLESHERSGSVLMPTGTSPALYLTGSGEQRETRRGGP
ncbi:hypothetical protein ACCUM_3932 [Candidatus Accumulibacter phosphatis]|uniref:Uncharacterized protein n=1 Tax=Candidatus Accumulibacter phosphatis TaxID=327160 RepID=A0A5S4EN24_9PROT|nr:hypothetical protein ACCUM_3932 [Candidatus Accumulibacter phosphatis]